MIQQFAESNIGVVLLVLLLLVIANAIRAGYTIYRSRHLWRGKRNDPQGFEVIRKDDHNPA